MSEGTVAEGRARKARKRRPTLTVRLDGQLRRQLEAAAGLHTRSLSEEIEFRLHRDLAWEISKQNMQRYEREAREELDAAKIQAIRQAGLQIVREVGGDVTVNVSMALLMAEADGVLKSGFIDTREVGESPLELRIGRTIEQAVAKAFEKQSGSKS